MEGIVRQRIDALRQKMREKSVDIVIIPTADPHLSEYIPSHYQLREYFSGFTGSAGILLVGLKKAVLYVDGRYVTQAKKQLEKTEIELIQYVGRDQLQYVSWILKAQKKGTLAFDGTLFPVSIGQGLIEQLSSQNWKVIAKASWIGDLWKKRPPLPSSRIYEHAKNWVDLTRQQKIDAIREKMSALKASAYFVSKLDEIAWLLNLRGNDIAYNPVFISYLLITQKQVRLFVDKQKIDASLQEKLEKDGVYLYTYKKVFKQLKKYQGSLLIDSTQISFAVYNKLHKKIEKIDQRSLIATLKAIKGQKEKQHLINTMVDDGVAFCRFWNWLDNQVKGQNWTLSEIDIAKKIEEERSKISNYKGPSFETIAAFNENAALPHYVATLQNHAIIDRNGLLLIDTGGQYLSGTTDMTRVLAIGSVTAEQKRDYTLVLKAMIALAMQVFPSGLCGCAIDAVARSPLWNEFLDYAHGTGHGVGYFLNVHEGPQQISCYAKSSRESVIVPGVVTSIEPGLYRVGKWGIRIENLALTISAMQNEFGDFMSFQTLTCCPIDQRVIQVDLLTQAEKKWLNQYHEWVYKTLSPKLGKPLLPWLKKHTSPLK